MATPARQPDPPQDEDLPPELLAIIAGLARRNARLDYCLQNENPESSRDPAQ